MATRQAWLETRRHAARGGKPTLVHQSLPAPGHRLGGPHCPGDPPEAGRRTVRRAGVKRITITMRGMSLPRCALVRMTGATFATVLALSACGGASGTNAARSPEPRVTVTVTTTVTATPSPSPSVTSSPLVPSPGEASYYLADFN